jgi:hypothetical protein
MGSSVYRSRGKTAHGRNPKTDQVQAIMIPNHKINGINVERGAYIVNGWEQRQNRSRI